MTAPNLTTGKNVVVTDFDGGEGILVDPNTKRYYQLNETAMLVWRGLEQGKSIGEIAADFTLAYAVEPERATSSVRRLVNSHDRDLPAVALGVSGGTQRLSICGVERDDGGRRIRTRSQLLDPARRNSFRRDN